jgi:hypothetical protein
VYENQLREAGGIFSEHLFHSGEATMGNYGMVLMLNLGAFGVTLRCMRTS